MAIREEVIAAIAVAKQPGRDTQVNPVYAEERPELEPIADAVIAIVLDRAAKVLRDEADAHAGKFSGLDAREAVRWSADSIRTLAEEPK